MKWAKGSSRETSLCADKRAKVAQTGLQHANVTQHPTVLEPKCRLESPCQAARDRGFRQGFPGELHSQDQTGDRPDPS